MTAGNLSTEQHAEIAKQHGDMGDKRSEMDKALAELEALEAAENEQAPSRAFPGKI